MIDNNTKVINELIAKSLAKCAIVLLVLLLLVPIGIFDFSKTIIFIIIFAGIPATLFPIVFLKLNVSDKFLQSYMLIALGIVVGLLGTQNGIGIYITYILVPLTSCLYLSKRFTLFISTICYFVMTIAVYINSAGKLEVIYKGWSHALTFRNYIIGFTIEYIVVMVFIVRLVERAQQFLQAQQDSIRLQKQENDKQRKITDLYLNALSSRRRTLFNAISKEMDKFTTEDFVKLATGHRFTSTIQDMLTSTDNDTIAINNAFASIGEYFGLARIYYIEPDAYNTRRNRLVYSWAKKEKYKLSSIYSQFSEKDYEGIAGEYDRTGYIQLIPEDEASEEILSKIECGFTNFIKSIAIGTQLWIPTFSGGSYNGAICFERSDNEAITPIDILLLSDIVTPLSMYIISKNSERANQAKSAFLSSMSHEIRTPMNAILGMTEVSLREEMSLTLRENLNIIKSSSKGLLAIINDILDFSKIESGRVEVIPENYTTLSMLNDLKTIVVARNLEKNLELSFNIPENIPSVLNGDMVRIKQVMVNLATNAVKYTDCCGKVSINVDFKPVGDNDILFKYSVSDTGQGIKKEDLNKLFTAFSQFNQEQNHHTEGTGLGLAISKQLVELMGGKIEVVSEFGVGSTFSFEIPQKVIDSTPAGKLEDFKYSENVENTIEEFTAPDASILIVDDNEINRMVAESMLEIFEMNIDLADGGNTAIEMTKAKKYDIIFMDHLMPDLDGIETTLVIRNDINNPNHDTIIVALTADAMSGVKDKMLDAGMNDFLSKPLDLKLCTKILKKYL